MDYNLQIFNSIVNISSLMGMGKEEKTIGKSIGEYRKKRSVSQEKLAEDVGISRSYLSEIERGERNPSFSVIRKIADSLNASIEELEGKNSVGRNIPESLRKFANEDDITEREVEMLSEIEYRGNQPESVGEWRRLYNIIKATLEEET